MYFSLSTRLFPVLASEPQAHRLISFFNWALIYLDPLLVVSSNSYSTSICFVSLTFSFVFYPCNLISPYLISLTSSATLLPSFSSHSSVHLFSSSSTLMPLPSLTFTPLHSTAHLIRVWFHFMSTSFTFFEFSLMIYCLLLFLTQWHFLTSFLTSAPS